MTKNKRVVHKYDGELFKRHFCGRIAITGIRWCCDDDWDKVTCKPCLKLRPKGEKSEGK